MSAIMGNPRHFDLFAYRAIALGNTAVALKNQISPLWNLQRTASQFF